MKKRSSLDLILLLLMIALLSATSVDATSALEGISWSLDSYLNHDNKSVGLLPDTEIIASFDSGVISGHAGCNNYRGGYIAEGKNITFSEIISTLMLCMDNVSTQESNYLMNLQKTAVYNISGNNLYMMDVNGTLLLAYSVSKPLSLFGTNWSMLNYYNGLGLISALPGTETTAVFGADGSLIGTAGCNNYRASYQIVDNNISISPIISTRKLCFEPEGIMEQEKDYLSALEYATSYRIDRKKMELYFENKSIAAIFELIALKKR